VRDVEASSVVEDGYRYDAIDVDPVRGSVGGGIFVTITGSGTDFSEGDEVRFGLSPCVDVTIISPTQLTCRTPPAAIGSVDVEYVPNNRDGEERESILVEDAFEYFDSSDPTAGGLGGGPINGSMNISVFDAVTGNPVTDAFVLVGDELDTVHQGLTGVLGAISFSGEDLVGEQTVHVGKRCYEKTSWVSYDARDVTIFLIPWQDLRCAPPGIGQLPGGGAGRAGAFVSGELLFTNGVEFEEITPGGWNNVPEPRDADWERVAYVYATQRCPTCTNPPPAAGGGIQRVTERDLGIRGYPYRIFVRPAAFATYALAGLENQRTGEFIPYVMGVVRNLLAGPGQEIRDADMLMNIPLDHFIDVRLTDLPPATDLGPTRFTVSSHIDLGGEGVIVRQVGEDELDVLEAFRAENALRFFAQPALFGALSDGRVRVEANWVTGDFGGDPSTNTRISGIRAVDQEVAVGGFPPIPVATSPAFGESIPEDRMLTWEAAGGTQPDFYMVLAVDADSNPTWRHFVRGDQTFAPIPNLESVEDIDDIVPGFFQWTVFAIRIPGFDFNTMSYRDLNQARWNAWAVDAFTARQ
ncbi:MAG: IPT/TIG domain-containing protein, partial [Myxococcota bacterium]